MIGGSDLKHHDGAGVAAQVVLAFLRRYEVEESWNDARKAYDATVEVNRWHNCREQGYTLTLWYKYAQVVHVTFFEHRNVDSLSVLIYEHTFINPPNIETIPQAAFPNKWHSDESFECTGEGLQRAAKFIGDVLDSAFVEHLAKKG